MHRLLITPESINHHLVAIMGENAKHLLQVLRCRVGDRFIAFDGEGLEYEVELISVEGNKKALGKILKAYDPQTEPDKQVILYQGIPKMDKMDWIIQKVVELGVSLIVPVLTRYSVPHMREGKIEGRVERWNRISREACKQSGRVRVPPVKKPVEYSLALHEWNRIVQEKPEGLCMPVFCYENESKKCLKDLFKCYNIERVDTIGVFIGPEGGFSADEHQMANDNGISPISLGKRILRTETAPITILSILMHEMGEMRV